MRKFIATPSRDVAVSIQQEGILGVGVIGFEHCAHKIKAPLIFTPEVNGFRRIPDRVGDDDMAALSILRFRNKLKIQNGPIH
jgi:hypothetical protein